MAIESVIAANQAANKSAVLGQNGAKFKQILEKKLRAQEIPGDNSLKIKAEPVVGLKKIAHEIVSGHNSVMKLVKNAATRTNYKPQELLSIQYKTGFLFLRVQMYSKTAENSANAFKQFTQMQV